MFHVEAGQLRTTVWEKDTKLLVQLGPDRKVKPDLVVLWASKKKKPKKRPPKLLFCSQNFGCIFSSHWDKEKEFFISHEV